MKSDLTRWDIGAGHHGIWLESCAASTQTRASVIDLVVKSSLIIKVYFFILIMIPIMIIVGHYSTMEAKSAKFVFCGNC